MARLGILVNPDAGLGGKLGMKGSDGQANKARSMGAEDRSGPRMEAMLNHFSAIHRGETSNLHWITSDGRMGTDWIPEVESISSTEIVHSSNSPTTFQHTLDAVSEMLKQDIDILIYSGGDGTTRDVVSSLKENGKPNLPIIGVPSGVKMHSGCFASSPRAAAEVLSAWLSGDLLVSSTEVLDLDEEKYRSGIWSVRLFAEAMTPNSPRWMQGSKELIEANSEEEIIEGLGDHILETLGSDGRLIIWGSGGTLRSVGEKIGFSLTTLGIDASRDGSIIGTDLNESELIATLEAHEGPVSLLLSPMGGQGFLIGRGNLQLSPEVLSMIGIENILGVVTPAKLLSVRALRIETGNDELDSKFAAIRYLKVLQGYRTTRVLPVVVD